MCMAMLRVRVSEHTRMLLYTVLRLPLFIGKFIPTRRTPGVSTSELLERIVSGYRNRDFDEKLTKMGHSELRAEGSDYDGQSRRASRSGSPTNGSPTLLSPGDALKHDT